MTFHRDVSSKGYCINFRVILLLLYELSFLRIMICMSIESYLVAPKVGSRLGTSHTKREVIAIPQPSTPNPQP